MPWYKLNLLQRTSSLNSKTIRKSQQHRELQEHFTTLGNSSSQTVWAIIRLSKPLTKPRTLRHEARDEIFQAPSPFYGGGVWVRG